MNNIDTSNDTFTPTIRIVKDKVDDSIDIQNIAHMQEAHEIAEDRDALISDNIEFSNNSVYEYDGDFGVINKVQTNKIEIRFKLHHDSGANRSITNNLSLLHDVEDIPPCIMQGANAEHGSITAKKKGTMQLHCTDDSHISVPMYYTEDVEGTIVSPTDVCLQNSHLYHSWNKTCNVKTGYGKLIFSSSENAIPDAIIDLEMHNGLWYSFHRQFTSEYQPPIMNTLPTITNISHPSIRTITAEATYELWHQRLCHPGKKIMESISHCVQGVPQLSTKRHEFYHCPCCDKAKIKKRDKNVSTTFRKTTSRAERFHMDFGFVRGDTSDTKGKHKHKLITSLDGFSSYLIIVDSHTRYTWVFTTASKDPPIDIVRQFLTDHGLEKGYRAIRTDQGGELYGSKNFRDAAAFFGYTIEPTGADNSAQNGLAERPNRTFGDMMRAILLNADLDAKFWSFALRYSVYVKNRLPHAYFNYKRSPYEAFTGRVPHLGHLRTFGCPVTIRKTGKRSNKLTDHTYEGRFLEYVGTNNNIRYFDTKTKRLKIASHTNFDEAYFTVTQTPPGARALRNATLSVDTNALC